MPNGISDDVVNLNLNKDDCRKKLNLADDSFIFSYTGVIGHAQGLEIIIHAAEKFVSKNVTIVFCGDGPELESLKALADKSGFNHFVFTGAVDKKVALQVVAASDAAIIPLKRLDLFKGAIPSKIFENCALGKPILLGVDGEAKELFVNQAQAGIYFEPENINELSTAMEKLFENNILCTSLGQNGKQYVLSKFSRKQIAINFLNVLEQKLKDSTSTQ